MASVQIPVEALFGLPGPTGVAVYSNLATLALEQQRIVPGSIVATMNPFAFYQAQAGVVAAPAATSVAAAAYGGTTTYWVQLTSVGVQGGQQMVGQVRAVATNIFTLLAAAYTGSLTGTLTQATATAIGTADGVTLAVGDTVLIPGATVGASAGDLVNAADAGPWVISVIGTGTVKGVLVRPSWWQPGTPLAGQNFTVSEGTIYAGTTWKSFAIKGTVSDSTGVDPALYPQAVTQAVTLAASFITVTNVPIRSLTTTQIAFQPTNAAGTTTTVQYRTGLYSSGGAATVIGPMQIASGVVGTATVSITATVAAGTTSATPDTSTGLLTIANW
jgi:hypothetical protein